MALTRAGYEFLISGGFKHYEGVPRAFWVGLAFIDKRGKMRELSRFSDRGYCSKGTSILRKDDCDLPYWQTCNTTWRAKRTWRHEATHVIFGRGPKILGCAPMAVSRKLGLHDSLTVVYSVGAM